MKASQDNNWLGGENTLERIMQAMAHGFQSINDRLDKLTASIDRLTATSCPQLVDESHFPYKVFTSKPELNHSSESDGVWTVVRYNNGIYAMTALHVALSPVFQQYRPPIVGPRSQKAFTHISLPLYVRQNLKDKNAVNILVSEGALTESSNTVDDFILVQLKDDIDLGAGKRAMDISCTNEPPCHRSYHVVALTAMGAVTASLPERIESNDEFFTRCLLRCCIMETKDHVC